MQRPAPGCGNGQLGRCGDRPRGIVYAHTSRAAHAVRLIPRDDFAQAEAAHCLRAFATASGAKRWRGRLRAADVATPMTYGWQGRQYVVGAAGGHGEADAETSDAVVAFALPEPGGPERSVWDRTFEQPDGRAAVKLAGVALLVSALMLALRRWRRSRSPRRRRAGG